MGDQGKRILVVDDNETNLDLLSRRLDRKGYKVTTAPSGPDALDLLGRQPFDMVLLDIMMPGMTGIEVLQVVRRTRPPESLPIIMTTAKSEANDVVEALDSGANDYVTKPIDLEVLLARMRVHMRPVTASLLPAVQAPSAASSVVGPGVVLDRKYRLDRVIGAGGFGNVYRGNHLGLDKDVAVKVLHPKLLESKSAVHRFAMEGVSGCRVNHPNAVAILDAGSTPEGVPYLVMELLEGRSLADELEEHGALPLRRCAAITVPVCDALSAAHGAGIIHRDIKPGNIMLSVGPRGEEVVKVLDFGLATLADSKTKQAPTASGIAGTPYYMAPERLAGDTSDARTDVYSLGVTIYEMLSARLPFPRSSRNAAQQAIEETDSIATNLIVARPDLPQELVRTVMAALARKPAERCRIDELRDAVSTWAEKWSESEWPPPSLSEYITGTGESHTAQPSSLPTNPPHMTQEDNAVLKGNV